MHWPILVSKSLRPVIIVGNGCKPWSEMLRQFAHKYLIPTVSSLPAMGTIATDDDLFYGMIGHTGHPYANQIVHESDLVIALGTRLDVRQTGTEVNSFAPQAKIIFVNNDYLEQAYPRVHIDYDKWDDCGSFLGCMLYTETDISPFLKDKLSWLDRCNDIEITMPIVNSQMARIICEIDEQHEGEVIFVTGVGSHQQHAARHLTLDWPKRQFLTSAGHGTMGAGLPMAIGAALETGKKVVLIDGDGSFQLSLNELGTVMSCYPRLDLHIHIIDNNSGGIVSQFCRLQGLSAEETTWNNPNFKMIAKAYGLSLTVHKVKEEGVWPILESNHDMSDMTYSKGVL